MARFCPIKNGPALYLECKECDEKFCEKEVFYCMVVGSRGFTNYDFLCRKMDHLLCKKKDVVIVSGGAKGADTLAKKYAQEKGYFYKEFPANWDKYGKRAGYLRNREMHEYLSKGHYRGVVAFWDGKSKGTENMIKISKKSGIVVYIVKI